MINYLLLKKKLPQYHLQCMQGINTSFYQCNTLTDHAILKKGTLYIGYSKHLKTDYLTDRSIGFLLLDQPDHDFPENQAAILFTPDQEIDIMELLYEVQCIFQQQMSLLNDSSLFIDGLLQEKNISELIDIGEQLLGNPIMLTNASFKVIYMSKDQNVADRVWLDAQKLGYCSAESISFFKQDNASTILYSHKKAFIYKTGLGKQMPRILKKITTRNKVLGYLVVFEAKQKLEDHHLEMTDFLCNFLAIEMKNNVTEDTTDKIYESLILDLLHPKDLSDFSLSDRLHSAEWLIKPILRLIYIEVDQKKTLEFYFDYIYSRLQNINLFARVVHFDKNILIVLNYNSAEDYGSMAIKIDQLLEQYQLFWGISRSFSKLSEIYDYYLQAKTALTLGKLLQKDAHSFYYKDLGCYHLLSCMENQQLHGLCSSHYILLDRHDQLNSTEYCETLYQYILAADNISVAAKALQIHRNTMTYRIEKITQITQINLANGEELFQFYFTKKIMNWLNKQL